MEFMNRRIDGESQLLHYNNGISYGRNNNGISYGRNNNGISYGRMEDFASLGDIYFHTLHGLHGTEIFEFDTPCPEIPSPHFVKQGK